MYSVREGGGRGCEPSSFSTHCRGGGGGVRGMYKYAGSSIYDATIYDPETINKVAISTPVAVYMIRKR
jgi:hypothetical protein